MYCTDFKEKLVRSLSAMFTTARVPRTTAAAPISSEATVMAGYALRGMRVGDLPGPLGAAGGSGASAGPAGPCPPCAAGNADSGDSCLNSIPSPAGGLDPCSRRPPSRLSGKGEPGFSPSTQTRSAGAQARLTVLLPQEAHALPTRV